MIEELEKENVEDLLMPANDLYEDLKKIFSDYEIALQTLETQYKTEVEYMRKGIQILIQALSAR